MYIENNTLASLVERRNVYKLIEHFLSNIQMSLEFVLPSSELSFFFNHSGFIIWLKGAFYLEKK